MKFDIPHRIVRVYGRQLGILGADAAVQRWRCSITKGGSFRRQPDPCNFLGSYADPGQGSKLGPLFPKSRSRSWHFPPYPRRDRDSSCQSWRRRRANLVAVANNRAGPPRVVQSFAAFKKRRGGERPSIAPRPANQTTFRCLRLRSDNHRPNRPSRWQANPKRRTGHSRRGNCGGARSAQPSSS